MAQPLLNSTISSDNVDDEGSCPQHSSEHYFTNSTCLDTTHRHGKCCIFWRLMSTTLFLTLTVETIWLCRYHPYFFFSRSSNTVWPTLPPHLLSYSVPSRYISALHAHENGTLFIPRPSPFIGPPSPELDELWSSLLEPRYFQLATTETNTLDAEFTPPHDNDTAAQGEPLQQSHLEPLPLWASAVGTPGVYGGIDMLHSLHCVNALRKALAASHGPDSSSRGDEAMGFMLPGETQELHLWHCIDQLRQAVLCHGDVTPVTLRPVVSGLGDGSARVGLTMLGETERVHQCRDGEAIVAWVKKEADWRGWV
nr:hypothetical protein CFP56_21775 [Quercus suber]